MRILIFVAFLLPTSLFGTPDDGLRIYEELIGYNRNFYFSIQTKHYPTGLYYLRIDSSFVVKRSLETGDIYEEILIQSATHRDITTLEDWETTEFNNVSFDFATYLKNNNVKYLYPEIYTNKKYRPCRISISNQGVITNYRDNSAIIIDIKSIKDSHPTIFKALELQSKARQQYPNLRIDYVKLLSFVGDENFMFFIIESECEPEYEQSILLLGSEKFEAVRRELIARSQ